MIGENKTFISSGEDKDSHPERSNQVVKVVDRLPDIEAEPEMYTIEFSDGMRMSAFVDELT